MCNLIWCPAYCEITEECVRDKCNRTEAEKKQLGDCGNGKVNELASKNEKSY